jgi:hypothetical protein
MRKGEMTMKPIMLAVLFSAGAFVAAPVRAEEDNGSIKSDVKHAAKKTGKTIGEAAETGGGAVRDSSLTVGRTVKAQVNGGTPAAKKEWKKNARMTRRNARAGGRKTEAASEGK